MFAVVVTFKLVPGQAEAFRTAMLENAASSLRDEPGCHRFDVCFDPDRPDAAFLYELYTDAAAFEAHLRTPHFAALDAALGGVVVSKEIVTWAEVVS